MKKRSKRHQAAAKLVDSKKTYSLNEAIQTLKQIPARKFDESVELHFQLGGKTDSGNESIRGTASLPSGSGKKVRVLCFCKGEGAKEAETAGAEFVGGEEYVQKVQGGWLDFDVVVSHPDMMREVSKLGKILGPKGMMPTPKTGTVTMNVAKAVKEIKAGRVEFKSDKTGGIHVACGKMSFSEDALMNNSKAVIQAVMQAKPQGAKADFMKRLSLSTTQGPGLAVDMGGFVVKEAE